MNVVILHCHYRRGGVTQVVENHVHAIADQIDGQIVLLSGGRNDGLSESVLQRVHTVSIDGFDYDSLGTDLHRSNQKERSEKLAHGIASQLADLGLDANNSVLHWHNHSLGKNVAAPEVIRVLYERHGFGQLLQIHDFAEDFRPENYVRLVEAARASCENDAAISPYQINRYSYPFSHGIQYATLTSGDALALQQIGIPAASVHVIPNCVSLGKDPVPDRQQSIEKLRRVFNLPQDARWSLYPVRGIRRKNVAELLLVSILAPETMFTGLTLPPTTPIEKASYERWRCIGQQVAPKTIFDAGTHPDLSFRENIAAADYIVSTSAAEGFGMAFLEPWLDRRGVIARKLPCVVDDFVAAGVHLDRFYESILVPGTASWIAECQQESHDAFERAWAELPKRFGEAWTVKQPLRGLENDSAGDHTIDFAMLTPERQIQVLQKISSDVKFEREIRQLNSDLVQWLAADFEPKILDHNADQIRNFYSLDSSGIRLTELYNSILANNNNRLSHLHDVHSDRWLVELICSSRPYFPCRTETEIAQ